MSKVLMVLGGVLLLVGATAQFAPGLLAWFGRLPGDIDIQAGRSRIIIPLTSMLLLSIAFSIVLTIIKRW